MGDSVVDDPFDFGASPHTHAVSISNADQTKLDSGESVNVNAGIGGGHTHALTLKRKDGNLEYTLCDGMAMCADGHGKVLTPVQ